MMTSKLPSLICIRLILKVPGQMAYLVASLTPDSASISPKGFLPPIMLLVVIIATVTIVVVVESSSVIKLLITAIISATNFLMAAGVIIGVADVDKILDFRDETFKQASDLLDFSGTGSLPSGRVDLIDGAVLEDEDGNSEK
ncbi:hypothetical protein Tco_1198255 [Tanacetum coccineum]